jgi:hypothetical protein
MIQLCKLFSLTSLAAVITVGCASPQPIYYSSGKGAHVLSCVGATWAGCLRDAGLICQDKGYEVLEKSSGREYGFFSDTTRREMVISCRLPPVEAPPQSEVKPVEAPATTSIKLGEVGAAGPIVPIAKAPKPKPAVQAPAVPDATSLLIKQ